MSLRKSTLEGPCEQLECELSRMHAKAGRDSPSVNSDGVR